MTARVRGVRTVSEFTNLPLSIPPYCGPAARALSVGRDDDACAHVRKDTVAGSRDPV